MQQSSATLKNRDVGIGLRKIVACSQSSSQCLLVSTLFGTVSSLIFILVLLIFYAGLAFDTIYSARRLRRVILHVRTRMRNVRANHVLYIALER